MLDGGTARQRRDRLRLAAAVEVPGEHRVRVLDVACRRGHARAVRDHVVAEGDEDAAPLADELRAVAGEDGGAVLDDGRSGGGAALAHRAHARGLGSADGALDEPQAHRRKDAERGRPDRIGASGLAERAVPDRRRRHVEDVESSVSAAPRRAREARRVDLETARHENAEACTRRGRDVVLERDAVERERRRLDDEVDPAPFRGAVRDGQARDGERLIRRSVSDLEHA